MTLIQTCSLKADMKTGALRREDTGHGVEGH